MLVLVVGRVREGFVGGWRRRCRRRWRRRVDARVITCDFELAFLLRA
jgi:hypothetical protein